MSKDIRIAINQVNQIPGDWKHNTGMIKTGILMAEELDVDLLIFPYMSISGTDSISLKKRKDFVRQCRKSFQEILEFTAGKSSAVLLSVQDQVEDNEEICLLIHDSSIVSHFRKSNLVYSKLMVFCLQLLQKMSILINWKHLKR